MAPDAGAQDAGARDGGSAPPDGGYFATLPPGSALPTGAECALRVRRSSFEPRPENFTANHAVPPFVAVTTPHIAPRWTARIDGNFTGTTDEIIQWGACKWGIDEDLTRARAVQESWWRQATGGDQSSNASTCALIGKSTPCYESYGLLQVRGTVFVGSYPRAEQATAWGVDYAMAYQRACFEGDFGWLNQFSPPAPYAAGDIIGCTGVWFSGRWYDAGARTYLGSAGVQYSVLGHLANKPWLSPGF